MGWLDAVFTGFGFVVKGGGHIVGGVATGVGEAIKIVGETVRKWGESVLSKYQTSSQSPKSSSHHNNSQTIIQDLEVIDVEFTELENKSIKDGGLPKKSQDRVEELVFYREQKFLALQEAKKVESAIDHLQNPDDYESTSLDNEQVHILQYQMGQVVLEKRCPNCGKPMQLQSRTKLNGNLYLLNDFFWQCVGYYNETFKCKTTVSFKQQDTCLLYKVTIPELQIPNSDFNLIYSSKSVQNSVTDRVREHKGNKDKEILCSIHHVPMVLREKKQHSGVALDMFFLACPHYNCGQMVKLKSPAQLAAFLRRREGKGIIS
jgi:hypothetical protein